MRLGVTSKKWDMRCEAGVWCELRWRKSWCQLVRFVLIYRILEFRNVAEVQNVWILARRNILLPKLFEKPGPFNNEKRQLLLSSGVDVREVSQGEPIGYLLQSYRGDELFLRRRVGGRGRSDSGAWAQWSVHGRRDSRGFGSAGGSIGSVCAAAAADGFGAAGTGRW